MLFSQSKISRHDVFADLWQASDVRVVVLLYRIDFPQRAQLQYCVVGDDINMCNKRVN